MVLKTVGINNYLLLLHQMPTRKQQILVDLQRFIEMVNTLNHKNIIKSMLNKANRRYSIKGLSLQNLKPLSVQNFIKRIYLNIQMTEDSSLQGFLACPKDQWGNSEYKIFVWICICYAKYKSKTIKFFNQDEDLPFIRHIFYRKSQDFIHFNLRRITSQNKISDKWTAETEDLLVEIIRSKSKSSYSWSDISFEMFTLSQRKSFFEPHHCRQRWINHLDPSVLKQKWTQQEDRNLIIKVITLGKKWAFISSSVFKGSRTQHMIKNRYNSIVRKHTRKGSKVDLQKILINLYGDEVKRQQQNTPLQYEIKQSNILQQIQKHHHDGNDQIHNEPSLNLHNSNNAQMHEQINEQQHYEVNKNTQMLDYDIFQYQFRPKQFKLIFSREEDQYFNQILF